MNLIRLLPESGLFKADLNIVYPKKVLVSSTFDLWHQRLGHPSNRVMEVVSEELGIKSSHSGSSNSCESCHLSKATAKYPKKGSGKKSSQPL